MATPDYVLNEDFQIVRSIFSDKVLPAGSFVRPIRRCWLPEHILNSNEYKHFNPYTEVYCYASCGIICIPISKMRKIS